MIMKMMTQPVQGTSCYFGTAAEIILKKKSPIPPTRNSFWIGRVCSRFPEKWDRASNSSCPAAEGIFPSYTSPLTKVHRSQLHFP